MSPRSANQHLRVLERRRDHLVDRIRSDGDGALPILLNEVRALEWIVAEIRHIEVLERRRDYLMERLDEKASTFDAAEASALTWALGVIRPQPAMLRSSGR